MTRRAFAVSLAAAMTSVPAWTETAAAVEGKIIDNVDKPVPDINVFLDAHSRQLHQKTKSNADGYYQFEDLVPGDYTLWCELPNFGCIMYPNVSLDSGQRLRRDFRF